MRRLFLITVAIALATASIPANAAAVAITAPEVAAALQQAGMPVGAEQVRFLAHVVAAEANPELQAVRADASADSQAWVQMRCRNSAQCIPFYVALRWPSAEAAAMALQNLQLASGPSAAVPNALPSQPRRPGEAVVVRSGEAATLVIEGQRMRMELPVICLQNGALGAKIRVASADRKQTYMAEVVSSKLLKARI
jgi:hypothetical protein